MRKLKKYLIISLAVALLGSLTFSLAFAQEEPPVGIVVNYVAGQSITIADQDGTPHEYMLSSNLKILPPGRENSLAAGSFVTIIAPASLNQGKEIAVGIVIHPQIPNGWNVPAPSAVPGVTGTSIGTPEATLPEKLPIQETASLPVTSKQLTNETPTGTAKASYGEMLTATPTPADKNAAAPTNSLIVWLAGLFRQLLTGR